MWDLLSPYNSNTEVGAMNAIRCCISCILPCGALDVIRVVHSNGHVEEIAGTVTAGEIMKAYPKHVLKKPSAPSDQDVVPKIVVVPPDALLQRGKIYFLVPVASNSHGSKSRSSSAKKKKRSGALCHQQQQRQRQNAVVAVDENQNNAVSMSKSLLLTTSSDDQYLSDILSERASTQRERRRGRVGVWRPHLESICESPNCM